MHMLSHRCFSSAPLAIGLLMLVNSTGCDQVWSNWKEELEKRPEIGQVAPDQDKDQLPDAFDCDPTNPEVHKEAVRPCALNEQETGETRCFFGVWSACTELPQPTCQDGEEQERSCERCGVQTQSCVDGEWVDQGECRDQKYCEPGESYELFSGAALSCGSGLKVTMLCNDQCEYDADETIAFAGCREDECCNGKDCYSAPFQTGCIPMPERIASIAGDNEIVYPE